MLYFQKTKFCQLQKQYENLISGTAPIESHLHNHLIEHLNSEIVSQTMSNVDLVTHWIRSSYLYIRAIQKPLHYGFQANATIEMVEQRLQGEFHFRKFESKNSLASRIY